MNDSVNNSESKDNYQSSDESEELIDYCIISKTDEEMEELKKKANQDYEYYLLSMQKFKNSALNDSSGNSDTHNDVDSDIDSELDSD